MIEPQSLLFIRLKGIGEVVMSLEILDGVRRNFPKAKIGFVVEPPHQQLLEGDERIDRIHLFDKKLWRSQSYLARTISFLAFLKELRRERYEIVIDLHGVPRSQWLAWAAKGNRRLGRRSGRFSDRFFHDLISFDSRGKHNIEMLHDFAGLLDLHLECETPKMRVSEEARGKVNPWLQAQGLDKSPLVGLHPGAISREPWPAQNYIRLGRMIIEELGLPVVVTAGPKELKLAQSIVEQMDQGRARVACFDHLLELAALLELCEVYVAGDTGPMHLATSVGTRVISVFVGLSDPARSGPYGKDHFVFHQSMDEKPKSSKIAYCGEKAYRDSVSAEEVFEKVKEVLSLNKNAIATENREAF